MTLHVGQKVVRVGSPQDPAWLARIGARFPDLGEVCTIRDLFPNPSDGKPLLTLVEYDNSHLAEIFGREPGLPVAAFRPVVSRKTDISIFTALLDGVKQGEPV